MGAYFEGIVNAYIFIFIICVGEGWKYIEKNYMDNYDCPRYCEVEHDHDMEVSGRFQLLENYGIPVVVTIVFGFFIWKQNQWIQGELLEELDEDNQRIENIIIKLIDQQKKVQLEQKQIRGYIEGIKDIMIKLVKETIK